jgi:hypothetical protein
MKTGNNISLEFTTTACNRPSILDSTYSSYTSNLTGIDFKESTLYINIDPSPNNINIGEVEAIARKYFGTVIANYPETSNFAAAALWCFSQVKGNYFFHLEDDWNLCQPVNINSLISQLDSNTLQCILNKKKSKFTVLEKKEPSFVPSLISTDYWKKYLPYFDTSLNPEYQFKKLFKDESLGLNTVTSRYYNERLEFSKDIGREWLRDNKLTRNYNTETSWSPWITWKI